MRGDLPLVPIHRANDQGEDQETFRYYYDAGVSANTTKAMEAMYIDFVRKWGGTLPATPDMVIRYMIDRAKDNEHAVSTIFNRVSMLARWHRDNRQIDPTKDALVKRFKKGIAAKHRKKVKQARPIEIGALQAVVDANDRLRSQALRSGDFARVMRCSRDKALILLAFWRGFRSSELSDLRIENTTLLPNVELSMFLPQAKTVSSEEGATFTVPALIELCPVRAFDEYLADTAFRYEKLTDRTGHWQKESRPMKPRLSNGPVFRSIKLDGQLSDKAICPTSIQRILISNYKRAGLDPAGITSHSARRGFAHWAMDNGWHLSALMQYVGWKSVTSAVKYTPSAAQFGSLAVVNAVKEIPLHIRAGNRLPGESDCLLSSEDED